jgi:hypothetical protein
MKKIHVLLICILLSVSAKSQNIIGAWESYSTTTTKGAQIRSVVIFADGYQVLAMYDAKTGNFIHSNGGTWKSRI